MAQAEVTRLVGEMREALNDADEHLTGLTGCFVRMERALGRLRLAAPWTAEGLHHLQALAIARTFGMTHVNHYDATVPNRQGRNVFNWHEPIGEAMERAKLESAQDWILEYLPESRQVLLRRPAGDVVELCYRSPAGSTEGAKGTGGVCDGDEA